MTAYSVDLDQVADHVARTRAFGSSVEGTLTHLDRVVADLHLTWTGRAADAHREAHLAWVAGAAAMREALAAMSAAAEVAHAGYQAAAIANLQSWGPLG